MDTPKRRADKYMRTAGVLAAGMLAAALAACGPSRGDFDEGSGASETTAEAPTSEPEADPSDSEEGEMPDQTTPFLDPSMGDSDEPGAEMTISGTVEAGVESGCLVLTHDGTVYGIFGDYDEAVVYAGAEVTLHGRLDPGMLSYCQQGTAFVVEDAQTAG